ncbi:MAG: hypothetical protein A2113_02165 [Candidatus Woykebacteria bacterium GWA1_44_8]|uniref:Uncharacterized protein n=1 Tax=Candidatus Woykebacteria bacterium GWA1_44_8 TaxID=1802591 RepID=A0A1G1W4Z6_9BACT|nr:MAG: hypothetical protein A2113_02165 [Candidatus Woykebacteria bacterium GWA1_44_8]
MEKNFKNFLLTPDFYTFSVFPRIVVILPLAIFSILIAFFDILFGVIFVIGFIVWLFVTYKKWKGESLIFNRPESSALFKNIETTPLTKFLFVVLAFLVLVLVIGFLAIFYFACLDNPENCRQYLPFLYNLIY